MRNHRLFQHRPRPWAPHGSLVGLLLAVSVSGDAWTQTRVLDQGTLRIVADGAEIGREEFSVTQGATTGGALGLRITAIASYPARRTRVTIRPLVEIGLDSLPRVVQFDTTASNDELVIAQIGRRRITIRRRTPRGESMREYPGIPRTLIVDDSVFALYAVPPGVASGTVRLLSPRPDTHWDYQLTNRGTEQVVVDGQSMRMLHLVLAAGGDVRHLWFDDRGRLMKVEIPSHNVYAERISDSR